MAADSLALAALAVVGLADALYFTLVTYRLVRPDSRWLPRVCRMDEATCARVVDTPYARVLGLPNAVYGMAWYALVLASALAPGPFVAAGGRPALVAVAALTVLLSAYLAWALLARLRVACVLCFLGHGVNVAIAALLALGALTQGA